MKKPGQQRNVTVTAKYTPKTTQNHFTVLSFRDPLLPNTNIDQHQTTTPNNINTTQQQAYHVHYSSTHTSHSIQIITYYYVCEMKQRVDWLLRV